MKQADTDGINKTKLVIFDLDGTLVDAYEAINKSMNFTLKRLGYPEATPIKIRKAVGWGDRKLLAAFIEEKNLGKALRVYRSHHRMSLKRYIKLLPYAQAALRYLKRRVIKVAIASNRPTEFTHIILEQLKIKKYFDYVLCADKLPRGKPHPLILQNIMDRLHAEASESVFVGDMALDVHTAHNAHVASIAVCTGSHTVSEIKKARPLKIIKSLAFLKKYL